MIQLLHVTKKYASGHQALAHVSFNLKKGEMAFLTGHSGAGKSTLLKLIMRIESASFGQIFVDGKNISHLAKRHVPAHRRAIGMIFQNPLLLPNCNVFNNVALPLVIAGFRHQETRRRVHAALAKVGLLNKEKTYPAALSSGEQQRVGIARAVVNKPKLLLADEPTGNLDPELSGEIMKLFADFNNVGVSVLVATHDLNLIAPLNYRILTLQDGHLAGNNHEE